MRRGLYGLIVSLKYYAMFLRTNDVEDAIRAVQHPKDNNRDYSQYSQEEQEKAVEVCRSQNQGGVALFRWRKNQTAYNCNIAFTVLTREEQNNPDELFQAVLENIDKQIEDYEVRHPKSDIDNFDESAWQFSILKTAIKRRTGTKDDVFKEYAVEWETPATKKNDPWEVLRERYKTREKRERKGENNRTRKKRKIIEEWHNDLKKEEDS